VCAALGSLIAGFGRPAIGLAESCLPPKVKSQPKGRQNGKQAEAYHIFGMTAQVPIHHMVGGVDARPEQKASRRSIDSDQCQQDGDADPNLESAYVVDQVLVVGRKTRSTRRMIAAKTRPRSRTSKRMRRTKRSSLSQELESCTRSILKYVQPVRHPTSMFPFGTLRPIYVRRCAIDRRDTITLLSDHYLVRLG